MRATAKTDRSIGLPQFLAIIVVAVIVIFAWDFGRRTLDTLHIMQASRVLDQQLREAQQENAQLTQLKSDVQRDDWVERKVRSEWHWTRENETIFVPAATPIPPAAPKQAAPPLPPPPERPFWQDWLEAIFGPPPGP